MRTLECGWSLLISIAAEIPFSQSSTLTASSAQCTWSWYLGTHSFLIISHMTTHWTISRASMSIGSLIITLLTLLLRWHTRRPSSCTMYIVTSPDLQSSPLIIGSWAGFTFPTIFWVPKFTPDMFATFTIPPWMFPTIPQVQHTRRPSSCTMYVIASSDLQLSPLILSRVCLSHCFPSTKLTPNMFAVFTVPL